MRVTRGTSFAGHEDKALNFKFKFVSGNAVICPHNLHNWCLELHSSTCWPHFEAPVEQVTGTNHCIPRDKFKFKTQWFVSMTCTTRASSYMRWHVCHILRFHCISTTTAFSPKVLGTGFDPLVMHKIGAKKTSSFLKKILLSPPPLSLIFFPKKEALNIFQKGAQNSSSIVNSGRRRRWGAPRAAVTFHSENSCLLLLPHLQRKGENEKNRPRKQTSPPSPLPHFFEQ